MWFSRQNLNIFPTPFFSERSLASIRQTTAFPVNGGFGSIVVTFCCGVSKQAEAKFPNIHVFQHRICIFIRKCELIRLQRWSERMRWSKKTEVISSPQHRSAVQTSAAAMENLAMTSAEARKLDLGLVVEKDSLKSVDEAGHEETHTLMMGQQYILERPESEGGPQVVKLNANGQLVSCEMLPHVGQLDADHQSLVLHVVPQGGLKEAYNLQHLRGGLLQDERYIEALPAGHYEQELLSAADITEEDRRIAQTLMAVQFGQQPKHKMTLEPLVPTTSAEANVIMSVADSMIVDATADHLGKVDHTQMVVEYIHQVDGSQYEPKGVRLMQHEQEMVELTPARVDDLHQTQHLKSINHGPIILRRTLTAPSNEIRREILQHPVQHQQVQAMNPIKNEEEEEFESGEDPADSDYEAGKESRSSRRSLPHKKRIPRKLKNVKSTEKVLKCPKCSETFHSQAELTAHKQTHNKKQQQQQQQQQLPSYNCELCNKGFPTQIKFFEHLKAHYEPIKKIEMQEEISELPPVLEVHEDTASDTKLVHTSVIVQDLPPALPPPLPCNQCNKVFRRQKALDTHIATAHAQPNTDHVVLNETVYIGEGLVPVPVEEVEKKDWASSAELTPMAAAIPEEQVADLRENTVIVPVGPADDDEDDQMMTSIHEYSADDLPNSGAFHLCDHCGTGFQLKTQLLAHIREAHSEPKRKMRNKKDESGPANAAAAVTKKNEQLTCPHCGRVFNHRNSLVYHLRSHTGERPHQCEVCGKSFFAASALKVHMRLHSGDKPYKCELCGRHFRQWGDLKYHCISIHTEEKQYQCEYCGKDFARKYSLIVHRRIHTGEKNYKCEFCTKTFRASSYLQNHRRIHTGEKPHPCEICGKPFRVRSDMKRHMNTHKRERSESNAASVATPSVVNHSDGHSSQEGTTDIGVAHSEMSAGDEVTLPEGTVVITEESLSQPINLNMSIPVTEHAAADDAADQAMAGDEAQFARDPLETVRADNAGNTLYVWPIYMG
ncbi:zinc finger protein 567-like [Neocloeon triangulifer]|uniref:zinc finger protein 567-like n=1 Tax=Neocloeon triangulifer TaxID=2078957 RepID=UPI00286EDF3B|nr:zinc finger protein 567-like [Neocloeon triangulifer]